MTDPLSPHPTGRGMREAMTDTECAITLTVDEHGWDLCRCDCGWVSPPCPDTGTALDFWGDHIMAEDTKGCE